MEKKKRITLTFISGMLALGMVFSVVRPLQVGAKQLLNAVWTRQSHTTRLETTSLNGVYIGYVKLDYAVPGVYSDPLPPPDLGGDPLPELGTIDLELQITQDSDGISGYVDLEHTLVFTAEHTLDGTAFGPSFTGSYDGSTLILESERVSLVSAGQRLMRQFRLEGSLTQGEVRRFSGEYRETLWGYSLQPLTIVGTFSMEWAAPVMRPSLYLPMIIR